ncbi:Serine/threonine-protein kinase dclk1 [Homalodisca vitripennis]|nr:Serine/threonine-protein kinase dclk1 [Homalodisca vitripennis]
MTVQTLRVADFGLAQKVVEPLLNFYGTPTYVTPEILTEVDGYGLKNLSYLEAATNPVSISGVTQVGVPQTVEKCSTTSCARPKFPTFNAQTVPLKPNQHIQAVQEIISLIHISK